MMQPAPPKTLEAIAGLLLPPACREDILGDLHERYTSPGQYVVEIASTVPHAILSRIRRTADLEVLLMEALVLYSSFLAAAWYLDPRFLMTNWQLFRLSIPAAVALGALMLADAYAIPGKRPTLQPIREAALSIAFAFLSQVPLLAVSRGLAVSRWIMLCGTYVSVEPFHLFRYLDEQAYRFNNRKEIDDFDRFKLAMLQIVGKRLTWDQLTGKQPEPETCLN